MKDDAGKDVRVLNPSGFSEWPVKGDARMAVLVPRIGRALRGNRWYVRFVHDLAGVAIGLLCLVVTIWVLRMVGSGLPGWVFPAAVFAVLFMTGRMVHRVRVGRAREDAAGVILEEGLCPSCGYNLHGIERDEGGRVVCPECGAAWNAVRIMRSAPFELGAEFAVPLKVVWSSSVGGPRWAVCDDRGRVVPLAHPWLRKAIRAASSTNAERLRDARREIARRSRWVRAPFVTLAWACAAGLPVVCASMGAPASGVVFLAVSLGAIAFAATVGNFLYQPRTVRDALVARRMCASCVCSLRRLPEDADGMTTCAECRAAWRLTTSMPDRSEP